MSLNCGKVLTMEEIFKKFDTDGSTNIDAKEAENAKNVSIFGDFIVEDGMNYKTFEEKNSENYELYRRMTILTEYQEAKDKLNKQTKESAQKFSLN